MLVIFGSAKLLDEIFERLHQPGIVGQILAGILIGPSVLAWMHPTVFLSRLADLGVMFLLFRVGLEVKSSDPDQSRAAGKYGRCAGRYCSVSYRLGAACALG